MRKVRNAVFETNSSTTHSLVLFNQIKACGVSFDGSKEVYIRLIPLCDNENEEQEKIINSLNHASYMVDYIYTRLMLAKYQMQSEWFGDNPPRDIAELAKKSASLIDKMQKYLVELGYKIYYMEPLMFNGENCEYDKIYVEFNDGSTLEYMEDFEEILESKESFENYLTNYAWVIDYNG